MQPKDNAIPAARNQLSAAIDDYLYRHTAVTSTIAGATTITRAGAQAASMRLEMATMATILRTRIVDGPNSQLQRNRDNNDNNMTREGGASAGQRQFEGTTIMLTTRIVGTHAHLQRHRDNDNDSNMTHAGVPAALRWLEMAGTHAPLQRHRDNDNDSIDETDDTSVTCNETDDDDDDNNSTAY
jgi:hypothetical protein